jgi:hypothetical protein
LRNQNYSKVKRGTPKCIASLLSYQSGTLLMPTKLPLKPGYKSKAVVNPQKLAVHPRARSKLSLERARVV